MANYGFIYVDIPMYVAIGVLSDAAQAIFGDRLRVRGVEGGVLVEAPGTGSADPEEAKRLWLPTGRDADMYCGKPLPGPVWRPDEQPVDDVVQDDPALRKAHKAPGDNFTILRECVADTLVAARAALMPPAPKVVAAKTEK